MSSFDDTNTEYSLAPTDDMFRFCSSKVKVKAGHKGRICKHHIYFMNYLSSLNETFREWP